MTTTYTKSLSTDFLNGLDTSRLWREINDSQDIGPECITVSNVANDVNIVFVEALSSEEQTSLTDIISLHNGSVSIVSNHVNTVVSQTKSVASDKYQVVLRFTYDGLAFNNINFIKVMSYRSSAATSYDVRIYDLVNDKFLVSKNLSNSIEALNDLGMISNVPKNLTVLEVQVKKNGGDSESNVYLDFATFFIE